ncbi:hypothetical protein ACFC0M_20215 [Streptomyces sp. NPDC056149]|uniref:hypothetical protein n=1 Tax=unclassified Streptomyces TaxID=2593676 RepID=UPI003326DBB7
MPSPYEHLTAAEELLQEARILLTDGLYRAADSHAQLAASFIEAAHAREKILPGTIEPQQPKPPLPEWCGSCDGPDLGLRFVTVTLPGEDFSRMARCPKCHPNAVRTPEPDAAL